MSVAVSARGARGAATVAKLLEAAASIVCVEGAAAISVQRVAYAAGTSKALVHYHFAGKDALLIACAQRLAAQLLDAEEGAVTRSTPASALDDLWQGVMSAPVCGLRRGLLALMTDATRATAATLAEISAARRDAATRTLSRVERLFAFEPQVSRAALATAYVALIDGLTLDSLGLPGPQHRRAFDAFWLAVLSLDS